VERRALRLTLLGFDAVLFAGIGVFLLDHRLGVFLMLAGVLGLFVTRLAASVVGYRRTMRRPWPKVPPVEDDDDEW
jgi:hypothetical protein